VRNKHAIVVDVTIKGNKVDINYVDSVNMNYLTRKNDLGQDYVLPNQPVQESIHPRYNLWVAILLKTARAKARAR
jgi:hypothetical protein